MSNPNSFTFIPGQSDAQPAQQPARPSQPRESIEQIGGMTRFSMRFDQPNAGRDIENPDAGTPIDETGNVRVRLNEAPRHQSFTFSPESGASTSFVNASGMPASPSEATHVKIPRGDGTFDMTSVGAAEAMGLVVKGQHGYEATGRMLRGGQVLEPEQFNQVQARDRQQARAAYVKETFEAAEAMYGKEQFAQLFADHLKAGNSPDSFVAAVLGEAMPASNGNGDDDAPWRSGKPAIRPWSPQELAATQPRPAPADPAANVPPMIDVRVAPLVAKESALLEGTNPSAVSALKSSMAAAIASGDENTMMLAARAFAMETGASEGKAQEIVKAIGASVGAPLKTLAARVGVQPQQLLAALQGFDSEALGAALSQVAVSKNGSKLVALTQRALAAHQRRGNR